MNKVYYLLGFIEQGIKDPLWYYGIRAIRGDSTYLLVINGGWKLKHRGGAIFCNGKFVRAAALVAQYPVPRRQFGDDYSGSPDFHVDSFLVMYSLRTDFRVERTS